MGRERGMLAAISARVIDTHRFRAADVAAPTLKRRTAMVDTTQIREHMEVIGADGVHVGTVDGVEGDRIKLTKKDSGAQIEGAEGAHAGHHHYISLGLVAEVEGDKVRLSATAANAAGFVEEEGEA
jgi:hypothetical protein